MSARPSLAWALAAMLPISACKAPNAESIEVPAPSSVESTAPRFCGGEAAPGTIDAYFKRLSDHLAAANAPVPMEFYRETFGITAGGRTLYFRRREMGAGARALPSLEDWRMISRRGPGMLESLGYRGCLLDDGKVWFEVGMDGTFALSGFNKDLPWKADRQTSKETTS